MIEWKHINSERPKAGKMCLVFTKECLTTQAYYAGDSFFVPWGDEYPGSKQAEWWAELNTPNT